MPKLKVDDGRLIRDSNFVISMISGRGDGDRSFIRTLFGTCGLGVTVTVQGHRLEMMELRQERPLCHRVLHFPNKRHVQVAGPFTVEVCQDLQAKVIQKFDELSTRNRLPELMMDIEVCVSLWALTRVNERLAAGRG